MVCSYGGRDPRQVASLMEMGVRYFTGFSDWRFAREGFEDAESAFNTGVMETALRI